MKLKFNNRRPKTNQLLGVLEEEGIETDDIGVIHEAFGMRRYTVDWDELGEPFSKMPEEQALDVFENRFDERPDTVE